MVAAGDDHAFARAVFFFVDEEAESGVHVDNVPVHVHHQRQVAYMAVDRGATDTQRIAVYFHPLGILQHLEKHILLLFAIGGPQEFIHQREVRLAVQQPAGGVCVFGGARRKGQVAGVLVQTGQEQGGLDGGDQLAHGFEPTNHQRNGGADVFLALPGRLDVPAVVMVPYPYLQAGVGFKRGNGPQPCPVGRVHHDQPVDVIGCDGPPIHIAENVLVNGHEGPHIGIDGFGNGGHGLGIDQGGGHQGGKGIEIGVLVGRDDLCHGSAAGRRCVVVFKGQPPRAFIAGFPADPDRQSESPIGDCSLSLCAHSREAGEALGTPDASSCSAAPCCVLYSRLKRCFSISVWLSILFLANK